MTFDEWIADAIFTQQFRTKEEWMRIAFDAATSIEREACAKAAEGFTDDRKWVPGSLYDTLRRETAAAIRRRSNVEHQGPPKAVPLDGPVGPHSEE